MRSRELEKGLKFALVPDPRANFIFMLLALTACSGARKSAPQTSASAPPIQASTSAPQAQSSPQNGDEFAQFDQEFGSGVKSMKPASDPLKVYNRGMFWVNDKIYAFGGKPLLIVYKFLLPQFVRTGIWNAFNNLKAPVRIVNHAFTGHFRSAGNELARFAVNSTLGVGGLWDPGDRLLDIHQVEADFGQTLGHYGVGIGFPVVMPLLGQTDLRDGIGLLAESYPDPVYWVTSFWNYFAVYAGGKFNYLSQHNDEYDKIKQDALDPYTFIRDAYLQYRDNRVKESRGEK